MSDRGVQDGDEQPSVARRVEELKRYCRGGVLSLEGVRERVRGIPPDAVRGSVFFHRACENEGVTLEMIECLLDVFPDAARSIDAEYSQSALHCACRNKNPDPGIVRLLLDSRPDAVNHQDNDGSLPLHWLCDSISADETASLAILDLLIAAAPLSVMLADAEGYLPIHLAGQSGKTFPFCKTLIDAYPEALMSQNGEGWLPIHHACGLGNVETVKYIIELHPESIDTRTGEGELPIHCAARVVQAADIIRYLLTKDPDCASKTGMSQCTPLHYAANWTGLDSVRLLFDAYPEAINIRVNLGDGRGGTPLDVSRWVEENDAISEFLGKQLVYARQAEDMRAMTTPDGIGWLPLHRALRSDASLGAIKLLITGNRDALHLSDKQSAFPLHIACMFSSVGVVQYLLGFSDIQLHALNSQRDSPLHYACRYGNLDVVKYLLSERGAPLVSEVNNRDKLPIHLLWESDSVDRDSVEYVEANWLLFSPIRRPCIDPRESN